MHVEKREKQKLIFYGYNSVFSSYTFILFCEKSNLLVIYFLGVE